MAEIDIRNTHQKGLSEDVHGMAEQLAGKVMSAVGGSLAIALAGVGYEVGLYKQLARIGPCTPNQLAQSTGCVERYVRDWLINQTSAQFISYDTQANTFYLSDAQKLVFTDEAAPFYRGGEVHMGTALMHSAIHLVPQEIRKCVGIPWSSQLPQLFIGVSDHYKETYKTLLIPTWLPAALPSHLLERLNYKVIDKPLIFLDVGCGLGFATRLLAKHYPQHYFVGIDNHKPSIQVAQEKASAEGVQENCFFCEEAAHDIHPLSEIKDFQENWKSQIPGGGKPEKYDVVAIFDSLHDMADPLSVLLSVKNQLSQQGVLMLVEPNAADDVAGNLTQAGLMYSAFSLLCCTPAGIAGRADGKPAKSENLGTLAPDCKYFALSEQAGFSSFKKVFSDTFNRVFAILP